MEEYLRCPITLNLLEDPITVPCCGLTFSRAPFIEIFAYGHKKCPNCHFQLNTFNPTSAQINCVINNVLSLLIPKAKAIAKAKAKAKRKDANVEGVEFGKRDSRKMSIKTS